MSAAEVLHLHILSQVCYELETYLLSPFIEVLTSFEKVHISVCFVAIKIFADVIKVVSFVQFKLDFCFLLRLSTFTKAAQYSCDHSTKGVVVWYVSITSLWLSHTAALLH